MDIVLNCPYCGSGDVMTDYWNGVIVCRSCGSVISETIYDRQAWTVWGMPRIGWVRREKHAAPRVEFRRANIIKGKRMVWRGNELMSISSYAAYNLVSLYERNTTIIREFLDKTWRTRGLRSRSVKVRLGVAYAAYLHEEKGYSIGMAVKKAAQRLYLGENNLRTAFKIYLSAKKREDGNEKEPSTQDPARGR